MNLYLLLALTLLLACPSSLDWQSAGNMSSQNMTVINSYIKAKFNLGNQTEDQNTVQYKAGPFSDYLNNLWAPAWNVVIIFCNDANRTFDVVVYGYAFRDHWVWINGPIFKSFVVSGTPYFMYGSFIIWKDYNCKGWLTVSTNISRNNFPTDPTSAINTFLTTYPPKYDDIWNIAWKAVTYLETEAADFKGDHAYTMIFSQASGYYFGKFCASYWNLRSQNPLGSASPYGAWGSYLLLQMR